MLRAVIQEDRDQRGISLKDVLRIFTGAHVVKQQHCNHCRSNSRKRMAKGKGVPRRVVKGRIVERV
jgi:hypothetical protein